MSKTMSKKDSYSSVLILHHYMWPDNSPTSNLFSELAFHLSREGFRVKVFTAQESYIPSSRKFNRRENFQGVEFYRVIGTKWFSTTAISRLLSGFLLMFKWLFLSTKIKPTDYTIVGSDPAFCIWLGAILKILKRTKRLITWIMDLYPDAIVSEGLSQESDIKTQVARAITNYAYSKCDVIVDLGSCMRQRISVNGNIIRETITPWAQHEHESYERDSECEKIRIELFGEVNLALIYSGAIGRAHDLSLFLDLAEDLTPSCDKISFVISSYGRKFEVVKETILTRKLQIKCLDYTFDNTYVNRLKAADLHLVSVKTDWTGVVVPSKFFAALALGRPVIAAVEDSSSLAVICREYNVGWVLNKNTLQKVRYSLQGLATDPKKIKLWQKHVMSIYQQYFSKKICLKKWQKLLQ